MKATFKTIALALLMVLPSTMCLADQQDYFQINIDRVFMHVPGDYSVAYTDSRTKVVTIERLIWDEPILSSEFLIKNWALSKSKKWLGMRPDIKSVIVADVSRGEPMYVKVTGNGSLFIVAIHIHSAAEIGGGEWSTGGKSPRKQDTVAIQ